MGGKKNFKKTESKKKTKLIIAQEGSGFEYRPGGRNSVVKEKPARGKHLGNFMGKETSLPVSGT